MKPGSWWQSWILPLTIQKKRKIDFVLLLPRLFCIFFFFLQRTVANLNGTIEKFKIPVIVLLQWIIRDQTLCYYHQLHLWCNLHLLFSRFAKNRGLLGRTVSFSLQQWHFILCYHSLYAEGMWVWEKWMELSSLLKKKLNNQIKIFLLNYSNTFTSGFFLHEWTNWYYYTAT